MATDLTTRPRQLQTPTIRRDGFYTDLVNAERAGELTAAAAYELFLEHYDRNSFRQGTMCSVDGCTLVCVWDGRATMMGLGAGVECPEHGRQDPGGPLLVSFHRDGLTMPDETEHPRPASKRR